MKIGYCFATACLMALPAYAQINTQGIEHLIQRYQGDMVIGIEILDPLTGQVIYQHNPHISFHPASNTKLLTSYVALKELGPDYRFKTYVQFDEPQAHKVKSAAIVFEGDPTLNLEDYKQMIQALANQGVQHIQGDFLLDDTAFKGAVYAPGWTWDDFNWGYAPPITAYSLNENALYFKIEPNETLGKSVKIRHRSGLPEIKVKRSVQTVSAKAAEDCAFEVDQTHNTFSFQGCWPIGQPKTVKIANRDIQGYLPILIKALLEQAKIRLDGQVRYGKSHSPVRMTHESAPLREIVTQVLQDSNNFYAESLIKTLGYQQTGEGSFHQGMKVVRRVLKQQVGLDIEALSLYDGSGLSQYNLISPNMLNRLLYVIAQDEMYPIFRQALSVSGVNGTLSTRLQSFDTKAQLSAKTGTLSGHSTLSGYLSLKHGGEIIVSMMLNHSVQPSNRLKAFEDQLIMLFQTISFEA